MALLAGEVRDQYGAPIDRVVRVYRRDTGALIGATRSSAQVGVAGDTDYASTILLMQSAGEDGTQAIYDASSMRLPMKTNNTTLSGTLKKFDRCVVFNGTDSEISLYSGAAFKLTGDFTIEAWVRHSGGSNLYQAIVASGVKAFTTNAVFLMLLGATKKVSAGYYGHNGPDPTVVMSTTVLAANTWYHVALTRSGSTVRLFIDGFLESTANSSVPWDFSDGGTLVGRNIWDGTNGYFVGCMEELRVSKGVCRYTTNFTPPSTPYAHGNADLPLRQLGQFAVQVPYTDEVQVVCLDNAGGAVENDQIVRTFAVT